MFQNIELNLDSLKSEKRRDKKKNEKLEVKQIITPNVSEFKDLFNKMKDENSNKRSISF